MNAVWIQKFLILFRLRYHGFQISETLAVNDYQDEYIRYLQVNVLHISRTF
jgi:hypothetical protein